MSKEVQVVKGKMKMEFTAEERARIVAEAAKSELGHNAFARSVGIAPSTLSLWKDQHPESIKHQFDVNPQSTSSQDRLQELEEENRDLKTQLFKMKAFVGHKLFELEFRGV